MSRTTKKSQVNKPIPADWGDTPCIGYTFPTILSGDNPGKWSTHFFIYLPGVTKNIDPLRAQTTTDKTGNVDAAGPHCRANNYKIFNYRLFKKASIKLDYKNVPGY